MASASSLSTLQHITARKLSKLSTHHANFESNKRAILASVSEAETTPGKINALLDGLGRYDIAVCQKGLSAGDIRRFTEQAKYDPSVSESLLRDWQIRLEKDLEITSMKLEYAELFGKLVTEWVKYPSPAAGAGPPGVTALGEGDIDMEEDARSPSCTFDQVGRKEMHEQRKEWEKYAFTERKVDQAKIQLYLDDIFGTTLQSRKLEKTPLEMLRETMTRVMDFKTGDNDMQHSVKRTFDINTLEHSIRGVLKSDLLSAEKSEALAGLLNHKRDVLEELVDVLNMDLDSLSSWEWDGPVTLHMRRQLNGKYRVYMDEETHQAILLHFIGTVWAAALKNAFVSFYHSGAWLQTPFRSMNKNAKLRREYFLPNSTKQRNTVRNERRKQFQEEYFMSHLPNSENEEARDYGSGEQGDNNSEADSEKKSPLATKQNMLRLLTTEMILNTKIYGEFTVLMSDFKWFGPALSHDTIFATLRFFGVPDKWLVFFEKFLTSPVAFAQDGPNGQVNTRKCGIPMSHILSDALGEAVLFVLDFAVNKRTRGANIYRFHDDLWFWGQEASCVQAWAAIREFSHVMGIELNMEKTGSALVVADTSKSRPLHPRLPAGKIKWGFLVLDPAAGRWIIDQDEVDNHITELRRQLNACRSVMAWVQAWNSYVVRFFSTHFGHAAMCLGHAHNEMIMQTFSRIQRSLFTESGTANATEYLRGVLSARFGTDASVPDAFFYFPVDLGGLGLRNPIISIFATNEDLVRDPGAVIDEAFDKEMTEYTHYKKKWDAGELRTKQFHGKAPPPSAPPADGDTGSDSEPDEAFLSFEEYSRYAEELSFHLYRAYNDLLETPTKHGVQLTSEMNAAIDDAAIPSMYCSVYWHWIYSLYFADVKGLFGGGLQLGERDLLPVALVDVLRSEKVRWEG